MYHKGQKRASIGRRRRHRRKNQTRATDRGHLGSTGLSDDEIDGDTSSGGSGSGGGSDSDSDSGDDSDLEEGDEIDMAVAAQMAGAYGRVDDSDSAMDDGDVVGPEEGGCGEGKGGGFGEAKEAVAEKEESRGRR